MGVAGRRRERAPLPHLPFRENSRGLRGLCPRGLERWAPGLGLPCLLVDLRLVLAPLCLISARGTQTLTVVTVRITLITRTPFLGAPLQHLASSQLAWAGRTPDILV